MKDNGSRKLILLIIAFAIVLGILAALIIPKFMNELDPDTHREYQEMEIILTTDEVILNIGDSFNAKDYIEKAVDQNGKDVKDKLIINEAINTSMESEYEVDYIFKQNDQTVIKKTLHVIVQDISE